MSQKNPTLMERIENTEKTQEQLWKLLELNFNDVRKKLDRQVENFTALIEGQPGDFKANFGKKLRELQISRYEAEHENQMKLLSQLLDNNVVAPSAVMDINSIVTARYLQSGELVEPGYLQLEFKQFSAAVQAEFLGKPAGVLYELPNSEGVVLEVTGVYNHVTAAPIAEPPATSEVNSATASPEP